MLYGRTLFFIHPIYKSLHLLTPTSHCTPPPTPSPLATSSLFSVNLFLFHRFMCYILDSTYKWYHMVFVFLFLTYFTGSLVASCCWKWHYFILCYDWVIFHYIYMYHIFFIYSSINGHLGCFHVLAIVNSAAMNIGVHVSFWIIVLSNICPGVGLLDHMVALFLVFWGTSVLFSTVAAPIYIPTNSARGFPFLHTLSSIYCLWIFWWWPFWLVWGDTSL